VNVAHAALLAAWLPCMAAAGEAYLQPTLAGAGIRPILAAGEAAPDGYRLAGAPDGLGVIDRGDSFELFINHELRRDKGVVRAHGARGAFVSRWRIDKATLAVLSGQDAIRRVSLWNGNDLTDPAALVTGFERFCSADLPPREAFFNAASGKGFDGRLFLHGEETDAAGRLFATVADEDARSPGLAGVAYELPAFGRMAFENALAAPLAQDQTLVIALDDDTGGQVYLYLGDKRADGTPTRRAGLQDGTLYGVKVMDAPRDEPREAGFGDKPFTLVELGDARRLSGDELERLSDQRGVTRFLRPEDGAWDPRDPEAFYFATTDRLDAAKEGEAGQLGRSRLYRLAFDDIEDPLAGGMIETLLDGAGPQQMLDNLAVDIDGNVLAQEDPGNAPRAARIWRVSGAGARIEEVARANPALFGDHGNHGGRPATAPFTSNEEHSGILDATPLFAGIPGYDTQAKRYYLGTTQAHHTGAPLDDAEMVEGGQVWLLSLPAPKR
jgi:hypothetical protein